MQVNPVTKIASELEGRTLCVFCGAGTSLYSGIPLAAHLIQAILDCLGLSNPEKQEFLAVDLPFESVIEILLNTTGHEYLFNVFKCKTPNRNHIFFAELASRGLLRAVVTTNFDTLIENGLSDKGLSYYVHYSDSDLSDVNWDGCKSTLL